MELTLEQYKNEIKNLHRNLEDEETLQWISNERWDDGEAIPCFKVTKTFNIEGFTVKSEVSIQVREYHSDQHLLLSVSGRFNEKDVEGESLPEKIERIHQSNFVGYMKFVSPYLDLRPKNPPSIRLKPLVCDWEE